MEMQIQENIIVFSKLRVQDNVARSFILLNLDFSINTLAKLSLSPSFVIFFHYTLPVYYC